MKGKKIVLGVTGSIAAYKSALLVRLLVKAGAEVKVVMTSSAKDFITPLTLSTLSKHPVHSDYFEASTGNWNNHVELGLWADMMLIAPASANTLAKMANGICDNLLLAIYLSAKCPVVIAPAMDLDMWKHPSTQRNIQQLKKDGVHLIAPADGELASGLSGEGRMEEPEVIYSQLENFFSHQLPLAGKKVMVTAGPTHEAIDPVRFIGNRSSGKMGFAIAEEAARKGADVVLISGPTTLHTIHPNIRRIEVESASQMYQACVAEASKNDLVIMAAAVADYRPDHAEESKIKKKNNSLQLSLVPTTDILSELGKVKPSRQVLVGFALETDDEAENAKLKLSKKNLDYIVLNSLRDAGAGFGHDTNKISILGKDGTVADYPLKAKNQVAGDIINFLIPSLKK
ncbi:MAG TPA: bifunctional phosphopantothenoylcysteine decarboxylase/phosphopantothenate--cysteine ligase CoaBC [Bacteroidia bacterium]|nr:bifunctional phosphopantothenoylcysteine decarboxylase/phosphopantothenate--cysteine ligase CoaBC [Bacteroidia bacterium]